MSTWRRAAAAHLSMSSQRAEGLCRRVPRLRHAIARRHEGWRRPLRVACTHQLPHSPRRPRPVSSAPRPARRVRRPTTAALLARAASARQSTPNRPGSDLQQASRMRLRLTMMPQQSVALAQVQAGSTRRRQCARARRRRRVRVVLNRAAAVRRRRTVRAAPLRTGRCSEAARGVVAFGRVWSRWPMAGRRRAWACVAPRTGFRRACVCTAGSSECVTRCLCMLGARS